MPKNIAYQSVRDLGERGVIFALCSEAFVKFFDPEAGADGEEGPFYERLSQDFIAAKAQNNVVPDTNSLKRFSWLSEIKQKT